jgi:hypothetical protein
MATAFVSNTAPWSSAAKGYALEQRPAEAGDCCPKLCGAVPTRRSEPVACRRGWDRFGLPNTRPLDFERMARRRLRRPASVLRPDLAGKSIKRARQNDGDDHDAHPKRRAAHEPTNSRCFRRTCAIPRRSLSPLGPVTCHMLICRLRNMPRDSPDHIAPTAPPAQVGC